MRGRGDNGGSIGDEVKKYQIILADPPWDIKMISRKVRPKQLEMPYKTMKLDEIKSLPINKITDPNGCHLFLWTTHKWLPKAFDVVEAWGFRYNCCLVWDKTYGFTPFGFMWSTEFCLYGQLPKKWMKPNRIGLKTCITEPPTQHSRKPQGIFRFIEKFCGDLPRIELFARQKVSGWDSWGDEIASDTDL